MCAELKKKICLTFASLEKQLSVYFDSFDAMQKVQNQKSIYILLSLEFFECQRGVGNWWKDSTVNSIRFFLNSMNYKELNLVELKSWGSQTVKSERAERAFIYNWQSFYKYLLSREKNRSPQGISNDDRIMNSTQIPLNSTNFKPLRPWILGLISPQWQPIKAKLCVQFESTFLPCVICVIPSIGVALYPDFNLVL